ncbi:MAG: hypothetical protein ACFFDY_13890 [Candidatus Thorarchaeota archaeon]
MVHCHEMKEGDKYVCEDCGLEFTVTKGCDCADESACSDMGFTCCGETMKKV